MPRRLREKETQEQKSTAQTEEIPTPHNEARSEAGETSDAVTVLDGNNNNINPLLKIVFIHRILRFSEPEGIVVVSIRISRATRKTLVTDLMTIPRVLQLRQVNTNWSETIDYYSSLPSEVVVNFCSYLQDFVTVKHSNSEQHAAVARDALLWNSKYISDSTSVNNWCHCVWNIINLETNRIVFGTVSVRDAIIDVSKYCTDPESAYLLCRNVGNLIWLNDANKVLFGTASVRDAMLALSEYCTTSESVLYFCDVILNLIYQNESNKVLFATEAIRDAVLSVSAYINDDSSVCFWCRVVSCFHKTNPTLFCVEKTVTSLVKLSKIELDYQALQRIYWFLNVVLDLLRSDRKLFDTREIRVAVERFQEVLNDPDQVENLKKEIFLAVDKLSNEEYIDKARQLCVEFQKVVSGKYTASSSSADAAVNNNDKK